MELYNVQNNTLVKILAQPKSNSDPKPGDQFKIEFEEPTVKTPVASLSIEEGQYIYFGHLDGMYSLCYDMQGNICHMAGWTEVEPVEIIKENFEVLRKYTKRGGRGIDGRQPLKHVPVCEMNDGWLANTITYEMEHRPNNPYLPLYRWEQEYRKEHNITIND